MSTLDQIALSIELVLISVVEAVALTFLAENAAPLLRDGAQLIYVPYAIAGLLFILFFWSQSILHAVSFIRWPLSLHRMFLYFVLAFIQAVAYSNLANPTMWFFWFSLFGLLGLGLYLLDLRIIRQSRRFFAHLPGGGEFMDEVERRHHYELRVLVPAALLFNFAAFGLLVAFPAELSSGVVLRATLGILSALFAAGALIDCMANFDKRSALIAKLFASPPSG